MPKVEYSFNPNLYVRDLSQYFAIEVAKLFGGRVCLYTDNVIDRNTMHKVLKYAFVEITDGLYVDSYGTFKNAYDRLKIMFYDVKESNIKGYTLEDAKVELKKMGVTYTNVEHKKNAREFLRNNMLTFRICYDARYYTFGVGGQTPNLIASSEFSRNMGVCSKNYFICYGITQELDNNEFKFGNMVHKINTKDFVDGIEYSYGFKKNENWYYRK